MKKLINTATGIAKKAIGIVDNAALKVERFLGVKKQSKKSSKRR